MKSKSKQTFLPTAAEFRFWALRARPGERIIYFIGNLAAQRVRVPGIGFDPVPVPAVAGVAVAAWKAMEEGQVLLFQRRAGPRAFEYIAQKRKPSRLRFAREEDSYAY